MLTKKEMEKCALDAARKAGAPIPTGELEGEEPDYNLVVLIHEMCELGIDPVFWPNQTALSHLEYKGTHRRKSRLKVRRVNPFVIRIHVECKFP